jgi:hypothetical protein
VGLGEKKKKKLTIVRERRAIEKRITFFSHLLLTGEKEFKTITII